jgi:hypothetical protein
MPADTSLDHLVGAGEQRRRHVEAERAGVEQVEAPTGPPRYCWSGTAEKHN